MRRIALLLLTLAAGCKSPAKSWKLDVDLTASAPLVACTSVSLKVER